MRYVNGMRGSAMAVLVASAALAEAGCQPGEGGADSADGGVTPSGATGPAASSSAPDAPKPGSATSQPAAFLARADASGMVMGSFMPRREIRQLRDLTRCRTEVITARGREAQRLEKALEDTGMKPSSVISGITGATGRVVLYVGADTACCSEPGTPGFPGGQCC